MATKGYPGDYKTGSEIKGLDRAAQVEGVKIFHAGTKRDGARLLANGGRVLERHRERQDRGRGARARLPSHRPDRLARRLLPPRYRLARIIPPSWPGLTRPSTSCEEKTWITGSRAAEPLAALAGRRGPVMTKKSKDKSRLHEQTPRTLPRLRVPLRRDESRQAVRPHRRQGRAAAACCTAIRRPAPCITASPRSSPSTTRS